MELTSEEEEESSLLSSSSAISVSSSAAVSVTDLNASSPDAVIDLDAFPPVYLFIEEARRNSALCRSCGGRIVSGADRVRFSLRANERQFVHLSCVQNSNNFLYFPNDPRMVGFERHYRPIQRTRIMALLTQLPHEHERRMRSQYRPIVPQSPRGARQTGGGYLRIRTEVMASMVDAGPSGRLTGNRTSDLMTLLTTKKGPDAADAMCAICLAPLRRNSIVVKLPCAHEFHKLCIKRWLNTNPQCPIDRKNVLVELQKQRSTQH